MILTHRDEFTDSVLDKKLVEIYVKPPVRLVVRTVQGSRAQVAVVLPRRRPTLVHQLRQPITHA
jgi:hypothetical protein